MRDLLLATSVVLVCYVAFASPGRGISVGSLGVDINQRRFNGPLFGWLVTWVAPAYALGLATLACAANVINSYAFWGCKHGWWRRTARPGHNEAPSALDRPRCLGGFRANQTRT